MSTAAWNSPEILAAIPKRLTGELQSCYMYNANNKSVRCSKWVYDTKYRSSSRAIEWDLVCDKRWRVSLAHTISMFGVLTGAITLGAMADKYGRKFIFCLSGVSQLILGVMVAFIPEYWTFLVCRYLLGIFGSAGDSGFVLTFEIVGLSKRTPCGVAFSVFFALGIMLMAGWGALIDDRQILQVVYGLHGLLLIPHIWIMDESPRWLWAQGRVKESVGIVEKALKCNRFDETLDIAQLVSRGKVRASKGSEDAAIAGTADLFKTPNLRNRTLSVCFCWFASSIVYYGLYLNTEQMEGNPCVIIIVMAFGEIATYAAVIYLLDIWGRRLLISSMMFTSGLACIVAVLLPTGSIGSTAVVLVGKLFISRSFAIIYNYSAELFPTVVRNSAVGLGSMCARVSGALSPVMTLLVSFDPKIPVMIFGCIALLSGFLCFFLPETMNQPLPQSLEDGEAFGVGDTLFTSFLRKKRRNRSYSDDDKEADRMVPLEEMSKKVCWIEGVDTNMTTAAWNSSAILAAIPKTPSGELQSCYMYDTNNESVSCSKWVYDTTYRSSSRAIEWDLVCDQRWRGSLAQTMYMFGVFTGAIVLGGMADKYGRKVIFCLSGVLQLILGVLVAFIPEYWSFLVIRYLFGIFGSAGAYIPGFVLTMELVGPSKRTACGVAFQATFAFGIMLVAGWGALIDNRQILQVVYGLHGLLLIPHIWIMDESPRWLWAQGRAKESVDIVEKALKCNRSEETLDRAQLVSRGRVEASKGSEDAATAGTADLFKTPNLRNKTLNVCLCWFANSIVYYGLSLSSGQMEGNPYVITAVMGFVEIPSYAAVIYFLDIWGRRPLISSMMLIGGMACIVAVFMPAGSISSTAVVVVGKLFIAGSFAIIYNYSAELFPTVVRNSAMGLGSMCARLSGALTPLITLLDSFNPKIPAIIFGCIALMSGFLCFFLPETMNQPMPQSLADGETFGVGDTCFTTCLGKKRRNRTYSGNDKAAERMVPLEEMSKKV